MASKPETRERREALHWRRLGLLPGAPECVIKAAHRYFIEIHHPDRGGSVQAAQQVNAAADEVRGLGLPANEHVAAHFGGEPWHVLGLMANADAALVERVGRALAQELEAQPRLAKRVSWAVANFGRAAGGAAPRSAPPQPPRRTRTAPTRPSAPAAAGAPEGLVERIDFGTVAWDQPASLDLKLTWREHAPYRVRAEAAAPLHASVAESKALPGRFIVSVAVDWESEELARNPSMRGYTLDSTIELRWASGGEASVRVRGVLLYPAAVTAEPEALDLGIVRLGARARAGLILMSSSVAHVTVEPPAWLARVDGAGRALEGPLKLATHTPIRVTFDVDWAPIRARGGTSIEAGRPLRPTGNIRLTWSEGTIVIPASMVVETRD